MMGNPKVERAGMASFHMCAKSGKPCNKRRMGALGLVDCWD